MPKAEYGVFTTLLQIVSLIGIPAVGLQGVFAQQAAASMNPAHEKELAGVFRSVIRGMFFIWLILAVGVLIFHNDILAALKISNPAALWMTLFIGLATLLKPISSGVLQGRQNFLWMGWVPIIEGSVRFGGVCLIVGWLAFQAAGAMASVLAATVATVLLTGWLCRDCLRGAASKMDWAGWLKRVVPLTLGLGVATFMLSADMIFVQRYFPKEQTGYYAAAGMIGRALVYFTAPLTLVMFPKVARSKARGEKSNALLLTLGATALAGGAAALMCTFFPALPLQLVRYDKSYLDISAPLVPWFAWSMLPLTLSTVLINSLMARSQFKAVPWLLAAVGGYVATLYLRLNAIQDFSPDKFPIVIQTIGIFGLVVLAVCAWFTWGFRGKKMEDGR
jgi:O-antigen/teichoic acid export membrane protein